MKVHHQIKTFNQILTNYDGTIPLHRFLPTFFKKNKQMGSSDRRWASRYVYSFFRLGKALPNITPEERLAVADFLCHEDLSLVVQEYLPKAIGKTSNSIDEKIKFIKLVYPEFKLEDVYPLYSHLSDSIERESFFKSFFIQPNLFIRIEKKSKTEVISILNLNDISYNLIGEITIELANGTKLETLLPEGSYQVQDYSSQRTSAYFKPNAYEKWWDCCAASGGKSLLLHDLEPSINLMVSDLRESILHNLDERFRVAGIQKYQKKVLNLMENNDLLLHHYEFDGVVLDAPCSGSGTWGRTPEQISFFDEEKINFFSKLQKQISGNVVKYLKKDKPLIYITCSAFKEENEDVVNYMLENLPLKLDKMEVIKGYNDKADTMFIARLIKV